MSNGYRGRGRRDGNHSAVVTALLRSGCTVLDLGDVGEGCPDLLVGLQGMNFLIEVKMPNGKLTPDQVGWAKVWRGQAVVVRSPDEAIRFIQQARVAIANGEIRLNKLAAVVY